MFSLTRTEPLSIGSGVLGLALIAVTASAQTFGGAGGAIPSPGGTGGGLYSAGAPCSITTPSIFSSTIVVPVPVCSVDQIQLDNWTHTWVGDMQIVLVDPAGTGHNIMVRPGFNSAGPFGNSGDRLGGFYKFVQAPPGGPGGLPVPHAAATNMPFGTYTEDFGDPAGVIPGGPWLSGNTILNTTTGVVTPVLNGMASAVPPPPGTPGPCWPAGMTWELRIYDWAAGDSGAVTGWEISVNGIKPPRPAVYCVSKVNSLGCGPVIGSNWPIGVPSATSGSGFNVTCNMVINNQSGLLFYGVTGQAAIPFACATLCVLAPVKRTPGQFSGGTPPPVSDCSGNWSIDMNCFAVGACGGFPHPALSVMGTPVWCQWWSRDPGFAAPCNVQLSDALNYFVGP